MTIQANKFECYLPFDPTNCGCRSYDRKGKDGASDYTDTFIYWSPNCETMIQRLNLSIRCLLVSIFLWFLPGILTAQEAHGKGIIHERQTVLNCDPLYYYGIDCSHLRVTDGDKVPRNQPYRTVYPPAWIGYVEKEMSPNGYVRKALKKKQLVYRQDDIRSLSVQTASTMIIDRSYSFPVDTVVQAVKSYALTEKSGTGLVLIPENFSKPEEASTTWVVFFDLETREVLWAVRTTGKCGHLGYTAHWASGIIDGFKRFVRKEYR